MTDPEHPAPAIAAIARQQALDVLAEHERTYHVRTGGIRHVTDLRKLGPKRDGHPSVGTECPACHEPFAAGDYTTLLLLGPGSDAGARERAREGRAYNAVAVEIHWSCATGEEA